MGFRRHGPFQAGDQVQLTDPKNKRHTLTLKEDGVFHTHKGWIPHSDLIGLPERELTKIRSSTIAYIPQDPLTSLNPAFSVGWQVAETIWTRGKTSKEEARKRADALRFFTRLRVGASEPSVALDIGRLAWAAPIAGGAVGLVGVLVLGEGHLRAVLAEYQGHYNTARPHQGIAQRVPGCDREAPGVTAVDLDAERINRKSVLRGLINEYSRAA